MTKTPQTFPGYVPGTTSTEIIVDILDTSGDWFHDAAGRAYHRAELEYLVATAKREAFEEAAKVADNHARGDWDDARACASQVAHDLRRRAAKVTP